MAQEPVALVLAERQRRVGPYLCERYDQRGEIGESKAFQSRHLSDRLRVSLRLESDARRDSGRRGCDAGSDRISGTGERRAQNGPTASRRRGVPAATDRSAGPSVYARVAARSARRRNVRLGALYRRLPIDRRTVFRRGTADPSATPQGETRDDHARSAKRLAADDARAGDAVRSESAVLAARGRLGA